MGNILNSSNLLPPFSQTLSSRTTAEILSFLALSDFMVLVRATKLALIRVHNYCINNAGWLDKFTDKKGCEVARCDTDDLERTHALGSHVRKKKPLASDELTEGLVIGQQNHIGEVLETLRDNAETACVFNYEILFIFSQ